MTVHHNPALHEEPRNQLVTVTPLAARESLFSWLENTGRFQIYESTDEVHHKLPEDLDDVLETEVYVETEEEQLD